MTELPILLPPGYTSLVSVGDSVTEKQILAEKSNVPHSVTINIAEELAIPLSKVAKTIRMNPGDDLRPGDVIAAKSGFMGMGEQKVVSSVSGKISSYDRRSGDLTIELEGEAKGSESEEKSTILSPVAGIVRVCDNDSIVIETESDEMVPEAGIGGTVQAELIVVKHTEPTPLPLHMLTADTIDKIILTPYLDREGILKAVGIGVGGIVVTKLVKEDVAYLEEKGTEIPIIQITEEEFPKIAKWSGKEVFLDGNKKSIVQITK